MQIIKVKLTRYFAVKRRMQSSFCIVHMPQIAKHSKNALVPDNLLAHKSNSKSQPQLPADFTNEEYYVNRIFPVLLAELPPVQ